MPMRCWTPAAVPSDVSVPRQKSKRPHQSHYHNLVEFMERNQALQRCGAYDMPWFIIVDNCSIYSTDNTQLWSLISIYDHLFLFMILLEIHLRSSLLPSLMLMLMLMFWFEITSYSECYHFCLIHHMQHEVISDD